MATYFTAIQFWMLRCALQMQRKGQKTFPPQLEAALQFWKQLYVTAKHQSLPDTSAACLTLSSHVTKTLFGQGLLQMTQPSSSLTMSSTASQPALRLMRSFVLGLNPPRSVVNVGQDKQDWLMLLHLIASHRPAHLQRDYTTILLQVGDAHASRYYVRQCGKQRL